MPYILSRLHLQIGKHTGVSRTQHEVISHESVMMVTPSIIISL
jgi:hypothetical protein